MKKILFSCLLVFCITSLQAQTTLISKQVLPLDSTRPHLGPNGKTFNNSFFGLHFVVPTEVNDKAPVKIISSSGFRLGWMQKYRISNFLSLGYLVDFNTYEYAYDQTEKKDFPDTLIHKKQSIGVSSLDGGLYFRFNFDTRRGNFIGHYLDAGAYAGYHISRSYSTTDEIEAFDEISRNRITRLHLIERYQYGLYGAIGLNKFTIYGRYRLSDIIEWPYQSAELPRLTVGIGLCIF